MVMGMIIHGMLTNIQKESKEKRGDERFFILVFDSVNFTLFFI